MLNCQLVGSLPTSIPLTRNLRLISAVRTLVGNVRIDRRGLRIADSGWSRQVPPLPIAAPSGTYPVHTYQWAHPRGPFNVCVVVRFRNPVRLKTQRLKIRANIQPDLSDGIVVDSAEIDVRSANKLTIPSGLGDGYYPVFANVNVDGQLQSAVVDFKAWEVGKVTSESVFDEYGVPTGERRTVSAE